ncbi:MAG: hydrolase [Isosphaeraceae bacterium]|nr:hydrolase [Isosphaeraceae bacterium]
MRSVERLTAHGGALLVIDVQEKLIERIGGNEALVANTVRLIKAARLLDIPVWATEQYPKGLGPTAGAIAELVPHRPEKLDFHCCAVPELLEQLYGRKIRHVTLAGVETHVCVAQTALELMRLGFTVQVPADAVGSRHAIDWEFGLRRLENAGVVVSTTEAALFEWTETADHPRFKEISALVKSRDAAGV